MEEKLTRLEKALACLSFGTLIAAIAARAFLGVADVGVMIVLSVTAVMIWVLFFACVFFPSDWRLTEKQRQKISDLTRHQRKYRLTMIGFDALVAVLFAVLIFRIG